MSEQRIDTANAAADAGANATHAGALLRQARESAGVHVAALAVSLKVPVGKLEALEAGRLDLLPDAVFARALASSICRTLKLDPKPILDLLPQFGAARIKTDETGINAPFRAPGAPNSAPMKLQLRSPLVAVVALLLVGALVLLLLPQLQWEQSSAKPDPVLPPSGGEQTQVVPSGATAAADPALPATPAAQTQTQGAPAGPALAAVQTVPPAAPVLSAAATSMATAAAPAAAGAGAEGILQIQPRGETWVQVIDAKGVVALRKTLAAGETTSVSGTPPLSVVVGRADSTVVQVRGKAMDLAPLTRDNVARFEVK